MKLSVAMQILFWASAGEIAYVYFGYPLLLKMHILGRRTELARQALLPSISVIVPAHNEESTIEWKLQSLIDADYPRELVEILVGSDGSSDKTEDVVRRFHHEGVGLISFPRQQGKSAMQNGLVAVASGEILVFTDADSAFPPTALRQITENFADSRVGLVTAHAEYSNANETGVADNESLYLRYDTRLRELESECGILAMASGSLFAMRRSLWQPLDPALGDDFVLPLRVAAAGLFNVIDPRVAAITYLDQNRPVSMLRMKIRIISKDLRALLTHRNLLNPIRHPGIALGLWSHKLLRWLVSYFLLALFASSTLLVRQPFFQAVWWLQVWFYGLAAFGTLRPAGARRPWSIPASFCLVNAAALAGSVKCFAGKTSGKWQTARTQATPLRETSNLPLRQSK